MKEKIPLTSLFVDSTQIFQSLIRHENSMVLCSLTARESQDGKSLLERGVKLKAGALCGD